MTENAEKARASENAEKASAAAGGEREQDRERGREPARRVPELTMTQSMFTLGTASASPSCVAFRV